MTDGNSDIRKDMRGFIEENFLYLRPDVELGDGDDFLALGIIDSLGFVELVEEVQSRYGISIDDVEITEDNFGSIEAITGFVERKRAAVDAYRRHVELTDAELERLGAVMYVRPLYLVAFDYRRAVLQGHQPDGTEPWWLVIDPGYLDSTAAAAGTAFRR